MASISNDSLTLAAHTIRTLSADGVEKASSGHPGMPMGMAELGVSLWLKFLRFNPQDPNWIARDRFVLSNGHGSMFIYSMLHLCGYDVPMEQLQQFRQWGSITPGHPESFMTPGVETTTGPLGQGVGNAVGLAIGQKLMSERYASEGFDPVDHRVWCFCGDGCLMEGVSGEASSVAGHLGLDNLIMVYDDNEISIAGHTDLAFTEQVAKRYESFGWAVLDIDGHNLDEIEKAYSQAIAVTDRPTLIVAHTTIGKGSPNKANTHGVHGAALGEEELRLTKKNLGFPEDEWFYIPEEVKTLFAARIEEMQQEYTAWQEQFSAWKSKAADKAKQLESQLVCEVAADLEEKLIAALPTDGKPQATRKLSNMVLQAASANCSALVGGSADLEPSTLTLIKESTDVQKGQFAGLNLRFGVREHGMGAIMNGLSYYGGYIPYGSTFLCFLDYMRPAVRLAALSHLPALFIYTHDSVFLGEDGPTHQPIEHLAMLRMTPNLWMFRPADGLETAVCYAQAIERKDGPCALVFTRQGLPQLERPAGFTNGDIRKGAYTVTECEGEPEVVLIASGSEVSLAVNAALELSGTKCRVVSMPSWEVFYQQAESYRTTLLPSSAKKVTIEAATPFGWQGMIGGGADDTLVLGIDRFGASAPAKVIAEEFGFTPKKVAEQVKAQLL